LKSYETLLPLKTEDYLDSILFYTSDPFYSCGAEKNENNFLTVRCSAGKKTLESDMNAKGIDV